MTGLQFIVFTQAKFLVFFFMSFVAARGTVLESAGLAKILPKCR